MPEMMVDVPPQKWATNQAPPPFLVRWNTQDIVVAHEVLDDNEYRLPERLEPDDVIVDIGAHIGAFTVACLLRGAGSVHCYEPELSNFDLLCKNTDFWAGHLNRVPSALWRHSCGHSMQVVKQGYTAMHHLMMVDHGRLYDTVSLSRVLQQAGPRIRLLKLDCEGAEKPALDSVEELPGVEEVIGEIHYQMPEPGHEPPTDAWLKSRLKRFGFPHCEIVPGKNPEYVAHFFARRP